MKKRLLALLLAIVIVVGLVVVAIPASAEQAASTENTYKVGYAKLDVNPWILYPDGTAPEGVQNMTDESGNAIGLHYNSEWTTEDLNDVTTTVVYDGKGNQKNVGIVKNPLAGAGTASNNYAAGVLDDNADGKVGYGDGLQITATAVTDSNNKTIAFITVDSCHGYNVLRSYLSTVLPNAIKDAGGFLHGDGIYVNGSHSHSAPDIVAMVEKFNTNPESPMGRYYDYYRTRIVEAVVSAFESRVEVTMSKGTIDASDYFKVAYPQNYAEEGLRLNFLRHYTTNETENGVTLIGGSNFGHNKDASIRVGEIYQPDDSMQLLKFDPVDKTKGEKPVVLLNWRAHATFIGGSVTPHYSSDYIGFLRANLEEDYNVAFLQGAAGNVVPEDIVDPQNVFWKQETVSNFNSASVEVDNLEEGARDDVIDAAHYGYLLSLVAKNCLTEKMSAPLDAGDIRCQSHNYSFRFQEDSTNHQTAALAWYAKVEEEQKGDPSKAFGTVSSDLGYVNYPITLSKDGNMRLTDGIVEETDAIFNSYYHLYKVATRAKARLAALEDGKEYAEGTIAISAIMLGNQVAMVTGGSELSDRYNAEDMLGEIIEEDNDWLELEDTTEGGYGTPFILGYTNGNDGYLTNSLSYTYNEGSITYAAGSYESNTANFEKGTGEAVVAKLDAMLNELNKIERCQHCKQEVLWTPLTHRAYNNMCLYQADNIDIWTGHYYLIEDVAYNGELTASLKAGDKLCLDLNGHTMRRTGRFASITEGAELTIMDTAGNGTIITSAYGNNVGGGGATVNGTLNLYSGTLQAEQADVAEGKDKIAKGGVLAINNTSAVFNMYGGTIKGCSLVNAEHTSVSNNGYGAAIYSMGTINLMGGSVKSGEAAENGYGDCIYVQTGKVVLSGSADVDEICYPSAGKDKLQVSGGYSGTAKLQYVEAIASGDVVGTGINDCDNASAQKVTYLDLPLEVIGTEMYVSYGDIVAINGENTYQSLPEALSEAAENDRLILVGDATISDTLNITESFCLDLNGRKLTLTGDGRFNVADGKTLYCMDSRTADYSVSDDVYTRIPKASVEGKIAPLTNSQYLEDGCQYYMNDDGSNYSFHCVKLNTYAITVQANGGNSKDPSIYYSSNFAADEVVAEKVTQRGVALSILEEPTAENFATKCMSTELMNEDDQFEPGANNANSGNTTLLYNILNPSNSELANRRNANTKVYGKAYMVVTDENGEDVYLFGNPTDNTADQTEGYSLKDVVVSVNDSWDRYEPEQKDNIVNMLSHYTAITKTWDIPNIREYWASILP